MHFKIHKEIAGDRTITKIEELSDKERVDELANMLGTATATTRQNAEELLAEVKSQKEKVKKK
jgi:DNA repair ATPase RecN